ncbi:BTAD domain-containing putative transcriptional regulator [Nonomuraea angiospora]|uniref:DNA-binding SARP family transcriptional activator n=1 Tax=Nonomuraea angiospora TaxID=46172 RepID=A0ABR9LZD0_9ACTN|nr:AfsR/SARP family transcriptional regulator [Nonomuraea angiospora]MBE1585461.1 DNA-binding SARP family transcriptional activator [Nonomuraea angiospora]
MEFRLFGPLEVDDGDGNRLDLGTRKQRAVLARLALEPGRVVPLDRLIEELWAGEAPAKATATLQAYVSHLRRVLEPGRKPRTPPRVLLTREPGYVLDVTPAQTDVGRFAAWAADGARLVRQGRHAEGARTLDRALALWRGEPLAEFPDLAPAASARLEELRLAAEEDRLEARLALGEASVPDLEALTEAHPYRERAWGLLVLGLYRAGRQADALAALRKVRALLAGELGIEPGPELRRLEQAVFEQAPELDPGPKPNPAPASDPVPAPVPAGPGSDRLVAREGELRVLEELLARARHGRGGLALVTGEAGIGKTSLARAVADVATARGFRVEWGRCLDGGTAPAFWPWTRAGLIPPSPQAELFDLYDAVLAELRTGPLLVVLEDLHWADASSLKLLGHVAGELARTSALVVATLRPEPGDHPEQLRETLGALAREGRRLPLAPFDASGVRDYLRLRDVAADPQELLDRSGGNPFYLTELLRLPERERHLVPPGARDVIERRLARLPEPTRDLLGAAAVAGREVELDLLAALADRPVEEVMSRLEPALAAGLLAQPPTGAADYRFSHALVRQALDQGLTRLERARLHLRAAGHLETLPGADPAILAGHFAAGARLGGAPKAVTYAVRAAAQAAERHGYQEAVQLWELALDHLPPGDSPERCRVLTELGQARRTTGDAEGAYRDLTEAVAQAQRLGDRDALVAAVSVFGGLSVWNWRPYGVVDEDMVAILEDLLAGDLDDRSRAALLGTLGIELHYGPRRAEGERLAFDAVGLARRSGDPMLLARALNNYVIASFVPGRNPERLAAAEEMLAIPGLPREARLVARVLRMSCLLRAGELAEWSRDLARCEQLLHEVARPELEAMVRVAQTADHALHGRWAEAEALAESFPKISFGASLWGQEARRLGVLYTCRRGQGRVAELLDELVAAGDRPLMSLVRPLAILASLDVGRTEQARELLERWGVDLREDWSADFFFPVWGLVAAQLGTPDPGEMYERLLPIADQPIVLGTGSAALGCVHDVLAELALRLGRTEQALEHNRAAAARHRRLGLTYLESRSRARRAELAP